MSLARFALRICALHALKGATLVGDNVRDSDIAAIDVTSDGALRTEEDRPFVVLYTDDGTSEDTATRDLWQNGATDFVVESGIALAMTAIDPTTGENSITGVNIPATDAGFELTLDLIDRQVVAALLGPSPWADLWRRLSNGVIKIERRRAASVEDGRRIAARQLRIRLDTLADPTWGQPLIPTSPWPAFADALTAEEPDMADVLAAFLGPQETAVSVETIRRSRGHTVAESRALGYAPLHPGGVAWTIQTPVLVPGA